MDYQYNYEKTAQQKMRTTQAQGEMERMSKQALKAQHQRKMNLLQLPLGILRKFFSIFKKDVNQTADKNKTWHKFGEKHVHKPM